MEQCALLSIRRSAYYYETVRSEGNREIALLQAIMNVLKDYPFYGYRKVTRALADMGVTEKQVRRIMHRSGLRAIFPGKRTTIPAKYHKKYPYLLHGKKIRFPNQVWSTDITYIRLAGGYVYLVAVIDWYSRKILSWRLSNTMDASFCIEAVQEAIDRYGIPSIFNSDQGCQFTSDNFVGLLEGYGIRISMDGVNRALDNIYIERFWRSIKYEDIYLKHYDTMIELKDGIKRYMEFYNKKRFHQGLDYLTPEKMYTSMFQPKAQADIKIPA